MSFRKNLTNSGKESRMNSIIYLIGLIVVIYFVLKFFGLM